MAVNLGTLFIKVDADRKDYDKSMSKITKSTKALAKTFAVVGAAGVTALAAVSVKAVKAAADQEKAEARLESIAKKVTKATDEQIDSMKDLAAQYQKVSTFGDEVIITGQSQLLSFGLQADNAAKLTGSLVDLLAANKGVEATTQDAIDAANLLGKAFSGQVGSLSRVGIILNDTQSEILKTGTEAEKTAALVEILDQNYGGLAETLSQTTEGQLKQAQNAFGDILEVIGQRFLPKLNEMLDWILQNMPQIERVMVGTFDAVEKAIMFVIDNAKLLTTVLLSLTAAFATFKILTGINTLLAVFATTTATAAAATTSATTAATLFGIAIGGWVVIISGVVAAIVAIALNWEKVTGAIGKAIKKAEEFFKLTPEEEAVLGEGMTFGFEGKPGLPGIIPKKPTVEPIIIEPQFKQLEPSIPKSQFDDRFQFEDLVKPGTPRTSQSVRPVTVNMNIQTNDPDLIGNELVRKLNMQGLA